MNKKLQQRIVGSIAVLALLILILPHLFSSNEYKVPATPNNQENNTQTYTHNPLDDFEAPTVDVDPIPTDFNNGSNISGNIDPISESTWNNVTNQQNTAAPLIPAQPKRDPNLSVAEQLLAEANHRAPVAPVQNKPNNVVKNNNSNNNNPVKNAPTQAKNNTATVKNNPPPAKTAPQLPKIELIGTAQPKSNNKAQAAQPKFTWYVQVGSYSSKENANKAMMEYRKRGYSSDVAYLSGQFKVRIGPLKTQENAKNVQADLKRQGQNSYIIEIQ